MKMMTYRKVFAAAALLVVSSLASAQTQPTPPPEKTAVVYGLNIRYIEAGQGPTVILLHGLGSVKEIWAANIGALSAKYHVYALDQIGFGHSDKPLLEYKITTFVDFLHAFMQAQNLSKATLVGNSLGGWIAIDFAVRHPQMVDKIVLVDSAGLPFEKPITVDLNPASLGDMRTLLESIFYDKKMVTEEFALQAFTNHVRNNDGFTIQRTLAGFAQNQFEDAKLSTIHAPALVVWGRQDELIPVSSGEKLRDGIPGAKLVVYEQCGHVPQLEKPAEFNKAVIDFLGK
jgi:pimeloyl-ACP methyl ester carboxylesterase